MTSRATLILAVAIAMAAPASATVDSSWTEVTTASDGACEMTITGNSQAYRIAISGLEPGETGRYVLTNGDMTPIDWQVRADGSGGFARYYLPFRWNRDGGIATVTLTTESCSLSAAFDWQRAGVRVS